MVLRRVGVVSCAKISGGLYALLGLIAGCFFALFSLVGSAIGAVASKSGGPLIGMIFGVGAIIFFPILYGALGFIVGLISSALYNLLAGWFGGIEMEIE